MDLKMQYRKEIDGLRAIAILPVIIFHAGFDVFPGGFVGVDVFFVISGYLITTIIADQLERQTFSISDFYDRRARRILPALFVVMIFCIPLSWLWMFPGEARDFSQSLVAVSVFASNILLWHESGYFESAAELKPLLHTWSLAVEEQYYLIFPIFLMSAWALGKRRVTWILSVFLVASFVLAEWASSAMPTAAFYFLPMRAWELLIGALVALYMSRRESGDNDGIVREAGAWVGLVLIFYAAVFYDKTTPFPGAYALAPALGTALFILLASQETIAGRLLGRRLPVGIGLMSYGIYLWHQPLLAFARLRTSSQLSSGAAASILMLTFLLAWLSFRYVESPFRKGRKFSRRSVFIFSSLGTAIFMVVGVFGHVRSGFSEDNAVLYRAIDDWDYPGALKPTGISGYLKFDGARPLDILFFGDSHAEQFAHMFPRIAESGRNAGILSAPGCPPIPNLLDDLHPACFDFFDRLKKVMAEERNIKTIFVAGCFNCYFVSESNPVRVFGSKFNYYFLDDGKKLYFRDGKGHPEAFSSLAGFLRETSSSVHVVLVGDNPFGSSFDPLAIMSRKLHGSSHDFSARYPDFHADEFHVPDAQLALERRLKEQSASAADYLSMLDIVCPHATCRAVRNTGEPLYKDWSHMRPGYVAEEISPHVMQYLE